MQARNFLLRFLSLVSLLSCLYLSYKRQIGEISSIAGCGGSHQGVNGGCQDVLGSSWSVWLGLPVTTLAASLWVCVFVSTFFAGNRVDQPTTTQQKAQIAQSILGVLLLMSALWFLSIMVLLVKSFCPWCLGLHLCGIAAGMVLLWQAATIRYLLLILSIGFSAFILLPLGQLLGPKPPTHVLSVIENFTDSGPKSEKRILIWGQEKASLLVDDYPIIGSPQAKHIFVEFFDYTCESCRALHPEVMSLVKNRPEDVAFIMIPTPLERRCHETMAKSLHDHPTACDKAALALAAWKMNPSKFEAIHHTLMKLPVSSSIEEVLEHITKTLGESSLDVAFQSPEIDALLKRNTQLFSIFATENAQMPKLVFGKTLMHGLPRTAAEFSAIAERFSQ